MKRQFLLPVFFLFAQCAFLFSQVPSGYYYFARNKTKAELKTALHTHSAPQYVLNYGSGKGYTWEGFFYTDQKSNNEVYDMYSSVVRKYNGFSSVSGMHIEHSLPKSWWGSHENNAYKDLYHLYPADGTTNSTKNNFPLGEVTGIAMLNNGVSKVGKNAFGTTYTGNCFEPADEYKGDFARSYMYISTIYQHFAPLWNSPMMNNNTYPVWKPWAIELLMKWHKQDPVSDKERMRIEAVYKIQGNRNPFIDYPALADYIWGADTTKVFPFPEETEPFLLTPRRGVALDFGVILQNSTRTQNLRIQGVNINADIQLSLTRNNPSLSIQTQNISVANALQGIDIQIRFSPLNAGSVRDTLLIQGGGLTESLRIPIKALASADFIVLEPTEINPVGGMLQWISDPQATDYNLTIYQGEQHAGDLIISAYVEGSSWNKAIQLYNGTGKTIDLSKYSLQKQSNGAGDFGSTLRLNGMLSSWQTYVIAHIQAGESLKAKAQVLTDSVLQFNGNDAVALVRNGLTIDMVGHADAGADVMWGLDLTLQRKQNITHPISVYKPAEWFVLPLDSSAFLGTHAMAFTLGDPFVIKQTLTGGATTYDAHDLYPQNTYTYSVQAIRPDGSRNAINTMQLLTTELDAPVTMEALDVQPTNFVANWEDDLYTSNYLFDVYQVTGNADITEREGFDNVGTNGKPLPLDWNGTAGGTYTTATSSGLAAPSIQLGADGQWLQTKNYPHPVIRFAYMYRFPSAATGSWFILEGRANNNWIRIDSIAYKGTTAKTYPVYNFERSQNITAFRYTYRKAAGNLAIDDVEATYGNQDTVFISRNIPVSANFMRVEDLIPNSNYFYRVRSTLGGSVSGYSESIDVTTPIGAGVKNTSGSNIKVQTTIDKVTVSGLQGDEIIQVFSLSGVCLYQTKANASQLNIPFAQKGIFILRVQNSYYTFSGKLMK